MDFLSFAKDIGKNISKSLNSKSSQKPLDHAKQSAADAFKTSSKRDIQKWKQQRKQPAT